MCHHLCLLMTTDRFQYLVDDVRTVEAPLPSCSSVPSCKSVYLPACSKAAQLFTFLSHCAFLIHVSFYSSYSPVPLSVCRYIISFDSLYPPFRLYSHHVNVKLVSKNILK
jgi:hypothetical protein